MRHFLLSGPVATLPFGMGATAPMAVLIATSSCPDRLLAGPRRTARSAVAMTTITGAADQHRVAATGAQVASSGEFHWQSGPMESDGNVRFVKYYAGNVAAIGAAGRDNGTGLAVGAGVAPAFPPAGRLCTASVLLTLAQQTPSP